MRNYPPTAFLNGHPNITIFYFDFFASQKLKDENGSLGYARDIENMFEIEKV